MNYPSGAYLQSLVIVGCVLWMSSPLCLAAQRPPTADPGAEMAKVGTLINSVRDVSVTVGVRDTRGLPLDDLATVRLSSRARGFNREVSTKDSSDVDFASVLEGVYDLEVRCPGYQTIRQQIALTGGSAFFKAYIYLHVETDPNTDTGPPKGLVLSQKAVSEVDKGLAAMRQKKYDSAWNHFSKASQSSPSNPDVYYLRGNSDLKLGRSEEARKDFEHAIALEPAHEKALISLGQLQIQSGDFAGAIATLNKSFSANGAGWRNYYLLATAYSKTKQWKEAQDSATRAGALAGNEAAAPLLLLGEIESAGGNAQAAKNTWESLILRFPKSPEALDAKRRIEEVTAGQLAKASDISTTKIVTENDITTRVEERPWAPPDVDSKEYAVSESSCNVDDVLSRAMLRVKSQLANLEKFTATEHIDHQDINSHGQSGPIKSRQFSYLVFVYPYKGDSVFLEETRDGQANTDAFPTSLATVGLNSLGISVLQPVYRPSFQYQCQGLATVRGEAAWQIRFEEIRGANSGVRRWQKLGTIYNIPIKGRIWLSTTTYDILRIETDLREPMEALQLSRDHLQVDYGPVNFSSGKDELWLPWSADMYLELHGKRYYHRHVLTDYMLFGVDTTHKISLPKNVQPENIQEEVPPEKPQP